MPSKKYEYLLSDPNVKRWYNNIAKGSSILCDVNLRILGRFCVSIEMSPAQYAGLSRRKMEDLAQDFVDKLESSKNLAGKPISPGYVENCLTAVRSWAEWNRKPIERKIKIRNANSTPTLENERSPTQDELRRVLYSDSTPLRTRVSIALMAFGGPRPEVQGDYLGVDGLRIKDLPELEVKGEAVNFKKIPTMIVVRPELSKTRKQYFTFLGEEGCEILKQYLEKRIQAGERVTSTSGVITTSKEQADRASRFAMEDQSPFLRTPKISAAIKRAMLEVSLPWRPYVFRVYFDTNLLLAESKGLVSHSYQQFWMGHKGDIEAVYTVNKKTLPQNLVEDMRGKYGKVSSELLETSKKKSGMTVDEVQAFVNRKILSVARISQAEIDALGKDPSQLTDQEIDDLIQRKQKASLGLNGNGNQQVVPFKDVKNWIAQGWNYERDFPPDEAIISLPSH